MRVAAIDMGTNSIRLLVAEESPSGFRDVIRRLRITRLGEGVDRTKVLGTEALTRTLECVAEYAALCGELDVERLRVAGTSAVREASNRDALFESVRTLTGAEPELLSGTDEARLTFLGTLTDLVVADAVLLVDIGGGSTELVYGIEEPEHSLSLDIGCVRLHERFLASDPPSAAELEELRDHVRRVLAEQAFEVPAGTRLVGVAGTVTQLAALKAGVDSYDPEVTHHSVLSHGDVRRLARRLEILPFEQRKQVKGLVPGRVDVIVSGAEILLCVMDAFEAPDVLVSEKDILDGLVLELLDSSGPKISESP
jgi:exopolyphosphatase/guanosine-5'-triphosphate,3'-diphosphate pyrophosphatase